MSDTEELLGRSETELDEAIENINSLSHLIEEGNDLREHQANEHAVSMAQHQNAIDALTEAIRIIGALHSGGSWV